MLNKRNDSVSFSLLDAYLPTLVGSINTYLLDFRLACILEALLSHRNDLCWALSLQRVVQLSSRYLNSVEH